MSSRFYGLSLIATFVAAAVPAFSQTTPNKNGFTLQSETGDLVLKLSGYAQADGRFLCRR